MNVPLIILILTHFLAFILGIVFILFLRYLKAKKNGANIENHNGKIATRGHGVPQNTEQVNSRAESHSLKEDIKPRKSTTPERKPSKKELQRQQKKEEHARKRQEEAAHQTALEELRRKQSFNPRTTKPENVVYTNLAVSDGHLVPCTVGQTYYYHTWEYEGRYFFEFFCEQSKAAKAINNRSVILDPFCQKDSKSVPVDEAKLMDIIEFGEVDKELNIISNSIIRFK